MNQLESLSGSITITFNFLQHHKSSHWHISPVASYLLGIFTAIGKSSHFGLTTKPLRQQLFSSNRLPYFYFQEHNCHFSTNRNKKITAKANQQIIGISKSVA